MIEDPSGTVKRYRVVVEDNGGYFIYNDGSVAMVMVTFPPGTVTKWHTHEEHEYGICLDGKWSAIVELRDGQRRRFMAGRGEIIYFEPEQRHETSSKDGARVLFTTVKPEMNRA